MANKTKKLGAEEEEIETEVGTEEETKNEVSKVEIPESETADLNTNIAQLLKAIQDQQENNLRMEKRLESMATENSSLKEQLEFIADKGRLGKWEEKQLVNGANTHVYGLRMFHGKIVVGWTSMKTNLVYKNEAKAYVEDQTTELVYEDNSREIVKYERWGAEYVRVEHALEKEELLQDGTRLLHLVNKEGTKRYVVDIKFIN